MSLPSPKERHPSQQTFEGLPGTYPVGISRQKAQALADYQLGIVELIGLWARNPEILKRRQRERQPWKKFYEKRTSV